MRDADPQGGMEAFGRLKFDVFSCCPPLGNHTHIGDVILQASETVIVFRSGGMVSLRWIIRAVSISAFEKGS